jgi:hypothetical protein
MMRDMKMTSSWYVTPYSLVEYIVSEKSDNPVFRAEE